MEGGLCAAGATALSSGSDFWGPRIDVRVPLKSPTRKGNRGLTVKGTTVAALVGQDSLKCLPVMP